MFVLEHYSTEEMFLCVCCAEDHVLARGLNFGRGSGPLVSFTARAFHTHRTVDSFTSEKCYAFISLYILTGKCAMPFVEFIAGWISGKLILNFVLICFDFESARLTKKFQTTCYYHMIFFT